MSIAAFLNSDLETPNGCALKLHREATFGEVSLPPHQPQAPANLLISETGTAHAINYLTSGVAALSARSTGRGGARNRADRENHALTTAQIANLRAAERHAATIGLPFTRMISIHWEAAGVPLSGMAKATGRFTDLMAKALSRHGAATSWLWVHENGDGKGGHCHLLAHVPADLVDRLTKLQRGWLRRITGQPYRARVIHSRPIGKTCDTYRSNLNDYCSNVVMALAYVLKGSSPEAALHFGLERAEPGGRIIGKRCGTSQNIGAKARQKRLADDIDRTRAPR